PLPVPTPLLVRAASAPSAGRRSRRCRRRAPRPPRSGSRQGRSARPTAPPGWTRRGGGTRTEGEPRWCHARRRTCDGRGRDMQPNMTPGSREALRLLISNSLINGLSSRGGFHARSERLKDFRGSYSEPSAIYGGPPHASGKDFCNLGMIISPFCLSLLGDVQTLVKWPI